MDHEWWPRYFPSCDSFRLLGPKFLSEMARAHLRIVRLDSWETLVNILHPFKECILKNTCITCATFLRRGENYEKIEIHLYILLRTCLLTIPLHRFFSVIVPNLLSRLPATKVKRNFNTSHKKILLQLRSKVLRSSTKNSSKPNRMIMIHVLSRIEKLRRKKNTGHVTISRHILVISPRPRRGEGQSGGQSS